MKHNEMVPAQLVECVPNFSEGRNAETLHRITAAIREVPGIILLADERDEDHNRSVITYVGSPESVIEAAVRGAEIALSRIDLTRHTGVHPRIGALDVLPFVPVANISLEECAGLARLAAQRIWESCGIPCYLYEAAALRPERRDLAQVRRGQFEELSQLAPSDAARRPDVGGPALHPTAGATAVGARKFLIAWNVLLNSPDVEVARELAALVRQSSGGFPFVKALGLPLPQRGLAQVSMNITDFEETPLQPVFDVIVTEAEKRGVEVAGSELIGLVPRRALETNFRESLRMTNFRPESVLENRLEALLRQRDSLFAPGSAPTPTVESLAVNGARLLTEAVGWGLQLLAHSGSEENAPNWQAELQESQRLLAHVERLIDHPAVGAETGAVDARIAEVALQIAEHCAQIQTWLASERSRLAASGGSAVALASLLTIRHLLGAGLGFTVAAGKRISDQQATERSRWLKERFEGFVALL